MDLIDNLLTFIYQTNVDIVELININVVKKIKLLNEIIIYNKK